MEQKAGKKTVKMGLVPNALGKGPRKGDEIIPSEAAHSLTLSIAGPETKGWRDVGCGDAGLGFEGFVLSEGCRAGAGAVSWVHRQGQWHSSRGSHPQEMLPPRQG